MFVTDEAFLIPEDFSDLSSKGYIAGQKELRDSLLPRLKQPEVA
jgi:hypothetical protein